MWEKPPSDAKVFGLRIGKTELQLIEMGKAVRGAEVTSSVYVEFEMLVTHLHRNAIRYTSQEFRRRGSVGIHTWVFLGKDAVSSCETGYSHLRSRQDTCEFDV